MGQNLRDSSFWGSITSAYVASVHFYDCVSMFHGVKSMAGVWNSGSDGWWVLFLEEVRDCPLPCWLMVFELRIFYVSSCLKTDISDFPAHKLPDMACRFPTFPHLFQPGGPNKSSSRPQRRISKERKMKAIGEKQVEVVVASWLVMDFQWFSWLFFILFLLLVNSRYSFLGNVGIAMP